MLASCFIIAGGLFAHAVDGSASLPPPPTYPPETVVMTDAATYPDAVVAASKWHDSALIVVLNASSNENAVSEMNLAGVAQAWIGAALSSLSGLGFFWNDGTMVGALPTNFTNWAPGQPSIVNGIPYAIAIDAVSGYWYAAPQLSRLPAIVYTPSREVTPTLVLPEFEFPPPIPLSPQIPAWQTTVTIVCFSLVAPMLLLTVALIVYHVRTPLPTTSAAPQSLSVPLCSSAAR